MASAATTKLSRAQIADAMRKAGWPESAIPMGVAVALAESGGNPRAINRSNRNGSSDHGLFQINTVHKKLLTTGDPYNPVDNARMALKVYRDAGSKWTPWSVFKSGSYRKFYTGKTDGNPKTAATAADPDSGNNDFLDGVRDGTLGVAGGVAQDVGGGILGSLGYIGDQAFWRRFGIGLLAILLIIIGVWIVFRQPINSAVGAATNLHPVGRAATVAKTLKGKSS